MPRTARVFTARLRSFGVVCGLVSTIGLSSVTLTSCRACDKTSESAEAGGALAATSAGASPTAAAATAAVLSPDGSTTSAPLPEVAVEGVLNPDRLPAYSGPTGSVEGVVSVVGEPARPTPNDFSRCPAAEQVWGHSFRDRPQAGSNARLLADAVVALTGYQGFYVPAKVDSEEIRIEECAPTTRTLALTFGQRLDVKNLTNDFWTPVLEPGTSTVLRMATPHGDAVKLYPKKPGRFVLRDHDRKYAVVDVYAFLHPLHAASSTTGYYRIDGVPVGKLKVSTTHPHIDAVAEQEINVTSGVVLKVDLVLTNERRDAGAQSKAAGSAGDAGTGTLGNTHR